MRNKTGHIKCTQIANIQIVAYANNVSDVAKIARVAHSQVACRPVLGVNLSNRFSLSVLIINGRLSTGTEILVERI